MNDSPINVDLDVKVDLTKPTNKVVDTIVKPFQGIHKGIVKLFTACAGKWFANKDRQIALIAAQTEKDIEDVKAGRKEYRNGELINLDLANNPDAFYRQISENNAACDAKRLGAAMLDAALELSNIPEEEISDKPLNQTFFNHWRTEAELIDDEELRQWWSHLLVEEIRKPNSISPRTLDVAKNLSRDEAELFTRIAQGILENYASILVNEDGHPICGTYDDILALQDAGLVGAISSSTSEAIFKDKSNNKIIDMPFISSKLVILFKSEMIHFQVGVLTKAGREIYNIIKKPLNINQIKRIAEEISHQNPNATAMIFPFKLKSKESKGDNLDVINDTPLWTNHPSISATEGEEK